MPRPDEGLIHAWLDGQLAPDEAARIEGLAATDPEWTAAVAEARGLMAASSHILSALDHVPAGVVPKGSAARTGQRLPWWTKIAAAVVVVGGSVLVMQNAPDRRMPALSTEPVATQPTSDTQIVVAEVPVTSPPATATTNPGTTAHAPAAVPTVGVPTGAVIGSEDVPAVRREALAPQSVTPPAVLAPSAKTSVAAEQKVVPDAERVVADLSAPQGLVPKAAPIAAPQQASTPHRARVQNTIPAQRRSSDAIAFRSAREQQASLCYRLVPDSAGGPVSTMRAVRVTSDTLYLASLEPNPQQRAWLVLRDGMKGVMTTSGDLRSNVQVVATPTACPAP